MNVFKTTSVTWWSGETMVRCNGAEMARLKFGNWKKLGVITLGENEYEVARTSIFDIELTLRTKDAVLCKTWIEGIWNRSAYFEFEGVVYKVKWKGWGSGAVLENGGHELGAVEPEGWFSNDYRAAFPERIPLVIAVFVIWLVLHKRREDLAASAG